MIRYDLVCDAGHAFDSWFRDSEGYDALTAAGHVSCPSCGSARVSKAIMAPSVSRAAAAPDLAGDAGSRREARERSASFEYVGDAFAKDALAMHRGEIPSRPIRGEATPPQVSRLLDAGVPISPAPPEGPSSH